MGQQMPRILDVVEDETTGQRTVSYIDRAKKGIVEVTFDTPNQMHLWVQLDDGRSFFIDIGGPSNKVPLPELRAGQEMLTQAEVLGIVTLYGPED